MIGKWIDSVERLIFGATTHERAETLARLVRLTAENEVQRALDRVIERWEAEDEQDTQESEANG